MRKALLHLYGNDMNYKMIITERAEELLDNLVCYLLYQIKHVYYSKPKISSII